MSWINRLVFASLALALGAVSFVALKLMPQTDWQAVGFAMGLSWLDAGLLFFLWVALLPPAAFPQDPEDRASNDPNNDPGKDQ